MKYSRVFRSMPTKLSFQVTFENMPTYRHVSLVIDTGRWNYWSRTNEQAI